MFTITYDNTIPEIESVYKLFWKKYALRRTVLFSIVYVICSVAFINMIAVDHTKLFGWIGGGLCLGMLASQWLRPVRARKKIVAALQTAEEEKYTAAFYKDRIEIETVTASEKTDKSVITLATEEIFAGEKADVFYMFVNRSLMYIFPKRCLNNEEPEKLRDFIKEI